MTDLYRIMWRWHFYAGLIVLPVLAWLAVTGGLYLYKPEIERFVYADWIARPTSGPALDAGRVIATVERQSGARVTRLAIPADPGETWRATLDRGGARPTAFVDPGSGRIVGVTGRNGGVMDVVRGLHGLAITGPIGNALVEIVAGWTILLVLTGAYLWWPRRGQPALALRGRPKQRLFWRDLHASAGAVVGAVLLFLAATGLPWSIVWGAQLQGIIAANDLGRPRPPAPASDHGDHGAPAAARPALPWSLQAAPMPHAGMRAAGFDAGTAMAVAARRGLALPATIVPPAAPGAPWLVSHAAERAEDARVIYLDPASGAVLLDARAAAFGAGARAVEWGIAVHQGHQYGEVNRLLMLAGVLGTLLLALTAPVLWWKRRFAPPPPPADRRRIAGVSAIMVALGALFPLTGATMVVALVAERIGRALRPPRSLPE